MIAWHAIVFGIFSVALLPLRWPVYIFGIVLTGWTAKLTYLILGVAQLAVGVGLLKLKPWAHAAAVWFCIFVIVHSVVFLLLPDRPARMAELMQDYPPEFRADTKTLAFADSFFWLGAVFTWLAFGTVLWYLFTRKEAYLAAGKAAQVTS